MPTRVILATLLFASLLRPAGPAVADVAAGADVLATLRRDLADLHVLHDYRPGKNAFVLGLEVHSGLPRLLKPGDRQVLLDVAGMGSLRHIWETHGPGPSPYVLEFFVDGEAEPSLRGGIEDLIRAAQAVDQPWLNVAGSFVDHNSNNLYLPVPFERSLRIDLIPKHDMPLVFLQLDYRTEDDSLGGLRLRQTGEGGALRLAYERGGAPAEFAPAADAERRMQPARLEHTGSGRMTIEGPAILRRLALRPARPGMRLRIRFDDAESPSVDVDAADFLGPFRGAAFEDGQCFLPMPFARRAEITIDDPTNASNWVLEADAEPVERFETNWGHFHAWSHTTNPTNGYQPHPVLMARGRGHWLGLSLYESGHDHGGGDFVVVDGESERPAFLHGINGEDYFSFAYFGRGQNPPYSEAFDNATGRVRLHLESPIVFRHSIEVAWATLRDLRPRTVAFWYQDSADGFGPDGPDPGGIEWDVFGPAPVPVREDGNTLDAADPVRLFDALPYPATLDAGDTVAVSRVWNGVRQQGEFRGWARQTAVGPHLNLSYIFRHVMNLGHDSHLGYDPRCVMARTTLHVDRTEDYFFQFSYDDPIFIHLNDRLLHSDMERRHGFRTVFVDATLERGDHTIVVRLADSPGNNCGWAAISMRILDRQGRDVSRDLAPVTPR